MSQLNVICLISGGKDSLFSILHCLKHGHNVVALGNLHPLLPAGHKDDEEEDTDSFMYQTIGHSIVPLYEEALGIPLYREPIRGSAINAARDYEVSSTQAAQDLAGAQGTSQDETESLFTLLRRIMAQHPEANAVSAGAIMSAYQRTRIENVAARLGLTPLAFLWQYPSLPQPPERSAQEKAYGLLEDMAACGCEARIIKVASGGLDADMLWGDVSSSDGVTRRALLKAIRQFFMMYGAEAGPIGIEGAVLGEGGEYESLALNGPPVLWRKRIVVDNVEKVMGEGGTASVRFRGARCVPNDVTGGHEEDALARLRQPAIFDPCFNAALKRWHKQKEEVISPSRLQASPLGTSAIHLDSFYNDTRPNDDCTWSINNLTGNLEGDDARTQMQSIAAKLTHIINNQNQSTPTESIPSAPFTTSDIVFATVLLRSMSDFATVNQVYASLFTRPNPPARVAIACGDKLPKDVDVMCSFTFDKGPRSRRDGLHVQSRSYWAPANIGPYSQAIAVPSQPNSNLSDGSCVYVAGQIPLHPPTMELAWGDQSSGNADWYDPFLSRATLALQHLWRIGQANSVAWWFGAIAFLSGPHEIQAKAVAAYRIWQELHHLPRRTSSLDDEDAVPVLDAWDVKYGRQLDFGSASAAAQKTPVIPDWEVFGGEEPVMPPYLAVQVAELPRGSDVEWQALGARAPQEVQLTERDYKLQIEGQSDVVVKISQLTAAGSGLSLWCYIPAVDSEDHFNSVLEKVVVRVRRLLDELAPGSVEPPEVPHATLYTTYSLAKTEWPCLVVPCHSVYDRVGTQLAAGLVVHLRR